MQSKVLDKYRPLVREVLTRSSVYKVVPGLWILVIFLSFYASEDLQSWASSKWEAAVPATSMLVKAADATGMLWVRHALDDVAQPMQRTASLFKEPPPPVVEAAEVAPPVVPEDAPVGERWVGPADVGGDRVHRVLIVGASSIQYQLGVELERELEAYEGLQVKRHGKLGTGLVRDDFYDWPGEIERLMLEFKPDLVVAQFGGNDAQAITIDGERISLLSKEWDKAYERRLVDVFGQITARDATLIVLGMPVMKDPGFAGRIDRVNAVTQRAVARVGGRYVPTADLSSDAKGAYQVEVHYNGSSGRMRMSDGVHYSKLGARYMAHHLARRLEQQVPIVPNDPTRAVAIHRDLASPLRRKSTEYLAYVPRDVPPEGLPVLYLLHGAYDGWTAWSEHAHVELSKLAAEHRVIIVLPDGDPFGWYLDSRLVPGARVESYVVRELIPDVDDRLPSNGVRVIGGLSMGGHGALSLALKHPGTFRAASSMSGAVDLLQATSRSQLKDRLGTYEQAPELWKSNSVRQLVQAHPDVARSLPMRLSCGASDPLWIDANRTLHADLQALGVEHDWYEGPGGHTWEFWMGRLPGDVQWLAEQAWAEEGELGGGRP